MRILVFWLCLFKMSLAQGPPHLDQLVIRNVGQGQWLTHITNDICEHYDFGGEMALFQKLKFRFVSQCLDKKNILNLSHADLDHYSFIELIIKNSKSVCWKTKATDELGRFKINIPFCSSELGLQHQIVFYDNRGDEKNDRSTVFAFKQVLLPGDSPSKKEKIWLKYIKRLQDPKVLVLGHHGSRTSTSQQLLNHISNIKQAVASARYGKYRHPSRQVVSRLGKQRIPLIKTEDWGDIQIF